MIVETKKLAEYIQDLSQYISEDSKKELKQILAYGEKIKSEGEVKKLNFWKTHNIGDFKRLLEYRWEIGDNIGSNEGSEDSMDDELLGKGNGLKKFFGFFKGKKDNGEMVSENVGKSNSFKRKKYEYVDKMKGLERQKFVEDYLYDDILYSGELSGMKTINTYTYEEFKKQNFEIEECTTLDFSGLSFGDDGLKSVLDGLALKKRVNLYLSKNNIGNEGAKIIAKKLKLQEGGMLGLCENQIGPEGTMAISKMALKEGSGIDLGKNQIGVEGVKSIVKNMRLECGFTLNLLSNGIGSEGAVPLSKIRLKEGVTLDLGYNDFGNEGAKAIVTMKLKKGVALNLRGNHIGDEGIEAIAKQMILEEGVTLDLGDNDFGDEGVQAIIDNMKLKENVTLGLLNHNISENMMQKLRDWALSYKNAGIKCSVLV